MKIRVGAMLAEVLRNFLKKPATNRYPFEKLEMPDKFRGKLMFYADKCIGCKMCMRDCPTDAITIRTVGDSSTSCRSQEIEHSAQDFTQGADKKSAAGTPGVLHKKFECEIDLSRCIYCAQCVDSCPKKALATTKDVELAQLDIKKLKVVYGSTSQDSPKE